MVKEERNDRQTDRPTPKLELGTPEAQHVCYTELNKEALLLCQAGARRQVKLLLVGADCVGRQYPGHEYLRGWGRRKLWWTSATHAVSISSWTTEGFLSL